MKEILHKDDPAIVRDKKINFLIRSNIAVE